MQLMVKEYFLSNQQAPGSWNVGKLE